MAHDEGYKRENVSSFFDDEQHLWIELFDGRIPGEMLVKHPEMFMVEHDAPGRTMIDLTAYIALVHDIRRF